MKEMKWKILKFGIFIILVIIYKTKLRNGQGTLLVTVLLPKVNKWVKIDEFRLINALECIKKIFESVMVDQLNNFIAKNNILCDFDTDFEANIRAMYE